MRGGESGADVATCQQKGRPGKLDDAPIEVPQENPNALIFGKAALGTGGVWPQLGSGFGGELCHQSEKRLSSKAQQD